MPLTAEFFAKPMASPFLLSAAPTGNGYARAQRAYEAGWPGAVLSAPAEALDRVCADLERLRREFPDRVTLASIGGTASEADPRGWRALARRLAEAGAAGIECSLSPPVGPAGSHEAETWAQLVDEVLAATDSGVPMLFRLTAAAASDRLFGGIAAAFARHPGRLTGVTIGGASRGAAFAPRASADGVEPAIARAARYGLVVSSDAEPMSYRDAAHLLALGARTVQIGAAALAYGIGVVNELQGGLSSYLAERGLRSVSELVASAPAQPIPPAGTAACQVDLAACTGCGNCSRCPHLAIALDPRGMPTVDRDRCAGCGSCVELCLGGALSLHASARGETSR